jgi:hypothetical protein
LFAFISLLTEAILVVFVTLPLSAFFGFCQWIAGVFYAARGEDGAWYFWWIVGCLSAGVALIAVGAILLGFAANTGWFGPGTLLLGCLSLCVAGFVGRCAESAYKGTRQRG